MRRKAAILDQRRLSSWNWRRHEVCINDIVGFAVVVFTFGVFCGLFLMVWIGTL